MNALHVSVVLVALAGCTKTDSPAPRPAAVTDELVKMYEVYVSSFDHIMSDVERAGGDCELAAANVERDVAALRMPTAAELLAQMDGKPHEVEVWLGETYGPRFKAAAMRVAPMEKACSTNARLRAAMNEAMSKFPMMRKKGG